MTSYVELKSCPLCGCEGRDLMFDLEVPVVRCADCGLVYLNPQPRVKHRQFYDESYYDGTSTHKADSDNEDVLADEKVRRRLDACDAVVDRVTRYVPEPGRWLDIGCGPGFLLSRVKARGWQCTGLDSSPFAPEFARQRFGLEDVHSGLIEECDFDRESFDVISMQHVIEHLYEPVPTMQQIAGLLKPGGVLYLETPDIMSGPALRDGPGWLHIKIPEHVLYFSEQTLQQLLQRIGCEVVGVDKPVPGTGLMNRLCGGEKRARKFYRIAKKVPMFDALVGFVRSARQRSMPDVAEHIQVLARKRSE